MEKVKMSVYDLVPDDIVRVTEGDLLPADGVLICSKSWSNMRSK